MLLNQGIYFYLTNTATICNGRIYIQFPYTAHLQYLNFARCSKRRKFTKKHPNSQYRHRRKYFCPFLFVLRHEQEIIQIKSIHFVISRFCPGFHPLSVYLTFTPALQCFLDNSSDSI